jgi:hypothetical protein
MANLVDIIVDHYPPVSGISIPLSSTVTITFDRLMDTSSLEDTLFLEGPDTDQFVGPGLLDQAYPNNVSQGELDDFLRSPGYKGIVEGDFTFEIVSGTVTSGTKVTFTPNKPLAPSTSYNVHLVECLDDDGNTVSGHITWPFESGTGSIQVLPSNISTSVLAQALRAPGLAPSAVNELSVVSVTPEDHSVEISQYLSEIDINFDKELDPNTIDSENISVTTYPTTSHPNLVVNSQGTVAFALTTSGTHLKIKI